MISAQTDGDHGTEVPVISDADRDSLHVLPLAMIPLKTIAIRRARLIRNAHLDAVVEVFDDTETGSGQVDIEDLAKEMRWRLSPPHPDLEILRTLGQLPSYDVYSLRVSLRENGITVDAIDSLKLSPAKTQELTSYMAKFIQPLMLEIYGRDDVSIQSFEDVVMLFRHPDVDEARQKLFMLAEKLGIEVIEIPRFLEDYGDIFLSFSYYRNCLDNIAPIMDDFLESIGSLRKNYQMKNDKRLMQTCLYMESTMNGLLAAITGRFENFDLSTKDLWQDLSATRFEKVRNLIASYHTTIGGVLCALSVKLDAWSRLFPDSSIGGPVKRAEFIMTEMRLGFEKIQKIEDSAPTLAAVS